MERRKKDSETCLVKTQMVLNEIGVLLIQSSIMCVFVLFLFCLLVLMKFILAFAYCLIFFSNV